MSSPVTRNLSFAIILMLLVAKCFLAVVSKMSDVTKRHILGLRLSCNIVIVGLYTKSCTLTKR